MHFSVQGFESQFAIAFLWVVFSFAVGQWSFLLTVVFGSFLLTAGAFLRAVGVFCLQLQPVCLQWAIASHKHLN